MRYSQVTQLEGATITTHTDSPAFSVTTVEHADGSHMKITRAHYGLGEMYPAMAKAALDGMHADVVENVRGRLAAA